MDGTRETAGPEVGGGLLVTTAEAARMLGMGVRGFQRAVARTGTLKRHTASGRFRHLYARAKVVAWANEEEGPEEGGGK